MGAYSLVTAPLLGYRAPLASDTVFLSFSIFGTQGFDMTPSVTLSQEQDPETAASREAMRRRVIQIILVCAYTAVVLGTVFLPIAPPWKRPLFRGEGMLVAVYAGAVRRIKMSIFRSSHRGEYDKALRRDHVWGSLPFYGSSLRGMILFNAGRYREAQAFLKPLAFDGQGRPRLKSIELYSYALALENDNRPAEAQPLLEAAIPAVSRNDYLKVALATCLLTQEKDPERAAHLLEEAMATPQRDGQGADGRADDARRVARYAWALAACGRRQEAQSRIDEALQKARTLRPEDTAGVEYFVGEAWRVMGEKAKAQAAYDEAIRLQPTGVIAVSVQKALAKIGTPWHTWQPQT